MIDEVNQEFHNTRENLDRNPSKNFGKMKALENKIEAESFTEREEKPWRQCKNHRQKRRFLKPNGVAYSEIL